MSESTLASDASTLITDSTVTLRDGRVLALASVGKPGDPVIFHCHGHPCSRLEVALLAEAATRVGVQVIAIDRPGIGRSDRKKGYRILDWPDDLVEVADQLGIERFAVEGVSGGCAFAMVCAYKIPERLTACGLISTLLPSTLIRKHGPRWLRITWWVGTYMPWLYRLYMSLLMRWRGTNPEKIEHQFVKMASMLPEPDRKIMHNPVYRHLLAQVFAESPIRGSAGNLDEVKTLMLPWGFNVQDIRLENIFLWHGEEDFTSPIDLVRTFAKMLPHCTATFYPGEAHLSTALNHTEEILRALRS